MNVVERMFEWYIRPFCRHLYGLNEFITIFTNQKEHYTHDQLAVMLIDHTADLFH